MGICPNKQLKTLVNKGTKKLDDKFDLMIMMKMLQHNHRVIKEKFH